METKRRWLKAAIAASAAAQTPPVRKKQRHIAAIPAPTTRGRATR